ncbi:MAG TPA: helix-turn-helix domain-containing protein [Ramlibacter sp.]|nr:helix-turn-helix domain-containing protein [Ramlibacter sp.]
MADPLLTPMQLGRVLQSARKARKLSQADVGARLDLSQKRISSLENDPGSINVDQLLKLCAALGLELTIGAKAASATGPASMSAKPAMGGRADKVEW